MIGTAHDASRLHGQLVMLQNAERDIVDNAQTKISHSLQLDQYRNELQTVTSRLQRRKAIRDFARSLDETRRISDFTRAKTRIDGRRWSDEPPLSAYRSLAAVSKQAAESIAGLQPEVNQAREAILRFVKTLAEQAREAAALAAESASRSR